MRTVLLYGTSTATADNIATYDILAPTKLVGCLWNVAFFCNTDADSAICVLSKAAASQFATNNVKDILSMFVVSSNFVTSGLSAPVGTVFTPCDFALRTGERLAIHYQETGVVTNLIYALLYFSV